MSWFSRKSCAPLIGVDTGGNILKLVQLKKTGEAVSLIAGGGQKLPSNIKSGSINWQKWTIENLSEMVSNGVFQGKSVVAAMPSDEVFIDHIKLPKPQGADKSDDAILAIIKKKLPFDSDNAMIKYIRTGEDNVLVIATERKKIDRFLAIYEKAGLQIKSIGVWPLALVNSYIHFFGRRQSDLDSVVMLLDIEADYTNVVICRHKDILFAHSIPIGAKLLDTDKGIPQLVTELIACRRRFDSMQQGSSIDRLIFFAGSWSKATNNTVVSKDIGAAIAKQLEIPAQMGDCLAAVEVPVSGDVLRIDRRQCQFNWAACFGLSLS